MRRGCDAGLHNPHPWCFARVVQSVWIKARNPASIALQRDRSEMWNR
jgi:hypothetical protein